MIYDHEKTIKVLVAASHTSSNCSVQNILQSVMECMFVECMWRGMCKQHRATNIFSVQNPKLSTNYSFATIKLMMNESCLAL